MRTGRVSSGRVHLVPRRSRPGLSLPARGTSYPSVYSLSCRVRCAQISTGYVMPRAFIWVRWVFERRFVHAPVHAPPPGLLWCRTPLSCRAASAVSATSAYGKTLWSVRRFVRALPAPMKLDLVCFCVFDADGRQLHLPSVRRARYRSGAPQAKHGVASARGQFLAPIGRRRQTGG